MKITKEQYDRVATRIERLEKAINGGKGSGNFGHSGRPGKVGGSGSGKGASGSKGEKDIDDRITAVEESIKAKKTAFDDIDVFDSKGDLKLADDLGLDTTKAREAALGVALDSFSNIKDRIIQQVSDGLSSRAIARSELAGRGGITDPKRDELLTKEDYDAAYFGSRLPSWGEEVALKARKAFLQELKKELKRRKNK